MYNMHTTYYIRTEPGVDDIDSTVAKPSVADDSYLLSRSVSVPALFAKQQPAVHPVPLAVPIIRRIRDGDVISDRELVDAIYTKADACVGTDDDDVLPLSPAPLKFNV